MNWLLVAIAGLVINVIIRGIVGIFSSKQNVSSEQQVTNEPSQVVESTQLQQIDDEKLKEVEGELAQVESQLQKRESQLMEALDVADQLEQQVLLSLQTIKEKEHQLSQSTNVPDELARAQQQIIDMESNMFQLVDMVKNDNNTIKIDLKQRKQNTKSYTDALTQVKEFLKQQDRSLIEHSSFSEQDYRQQVEQIKEDYSALLSQIRDQEDNVEQLEKQLTQQNEQNRKLQDEQERELEQILQQKEDFQRKYQEVLSKMEDQIEEVRIQARNAQDKLSVLQSVLREIAGNGNASQIDQWFKQNGFETYESDQKEALKALIQASIPQSQTVPNQKLNAQIAVLEQEQNSSISHDHEQLKQIQQDIKKQQELLMKAVEQATDSQTVIDSEEILAWQRQLTQSQQQVAEQSSQIFQQTLALQNQLQDATSTPQVTPMPIDTNDNNGSALTTLVQAPPKTCTAVSAGVTLPHPNKHEKGGDDAFFVDGPYLGVADGVGGWQSEGVDAALYARKLMQNYGYEIANQTCSPQEALQNAQDSTLLEGSCTACAAKLYDDGLLEVVNVGDTGCRVYRNGKCVFKTTTQMHQFNMPYQLAWDGFSFDATKACEGNVYQVKCQEGDMIIMGSDGYFDNMWDKDTIRMLQGYSKQQNGAIPQQQYLQQLAQQMCEQAQSNAVNDSYQSPFLEEATRAGALSWGASLFRRGGKLDDCTVVLAQVM